MDFKIATVNYEEFIQKKQKQKQNKTKQKQNKTKNKKTKQNKIYSQFVLKTPRTLSINCWQSVCIYI